MKSFLRIRDLKKSKGLDNFLDHDFSTEIEKWALWANNNRISHKVDLWWNRPRLKGGFHPSSVYSPCDYRLFLDLKGEEYHSAHNSSLQLIFDVGTAIHGMLDYYFETHSKQHKYDFIPEAGFKPRYIKDTEGIDDNWITNDATDKLSCIGHADGLMTRVYDDVTVKTVVEFKTISSGGFSKLREPLKPHLLQVHTYMWCLNVPTALFVYINKDTGSLAAFTTPFYHEIWKPIHSRLKSILRHNENGTEPKKLVKKSCKNCGYYGACKPNMGRSKRSALSKMSSYKKEG